MERQRFRIHAEITHGPVLARPAGAVVPIDLWFDENVQLRDGLRAATQGASAYGRWAIGGFHPEDAEPASLADFESLLLLAQVNIELPQELAIELAFDVGDLGVAQIALLETASEFNCNIAYNESLDGQERIALSLPAPPNAGDVIPTARAWLRGRS